MKFIYKYGQYILTITGTLIATTGAASTEYSHESAIKVIFIARSLLEDGKIRLIEDAINRNGIACSKSGIGVHICRDTADIKTNTSFEIHHIHNYWTAGQEIRIIVNFDPDFCISKNKLLPRMVRGLLPAAPPVSTPFQKQNPEETPNDLSTSVFYSNSSEDAKKYEIWIEYKSQDKIMCVNRILLQSH